VIKLSRRLFLILLMAGIFSASTAMILTKQISGQPQALTDQLGFTMIGAGLAIGLAGLGAGLGMGTASAAAIGAVAEKPEVFARTLIYIVFIEAIAIYGLVVAFMILMKA
jgi:V/A-type H+-transporting ATPase subunit K